MNDFDRQFNRIRRGATISVVIGMAVWLSIIVCCAVLISKVMAHFGVI